MRLVIFVFGNVHFSVQVALSFLDHLLTVTRAAPVMHTLDVCCFS